MGEDENDVFVNLGNLSLTFDVEPQAAPPNYNSANFRFFSNERVPALSNFEEMFPN